MDSSASYTAYDEEEKSDSPGNGENASCQTDSGTPGRDSPQRIKQALEAATRARQGYVYFLESTDGKYVKIGFSKNPRQRLSAQKRLAARLIGSIPGTREIEQWLHKQFKSDLAYRQEWFYKSERLITLIGLLQENTAIVGDQRVCRLGDLEKDLVAVNMLLEVSLIEAIEKFRWEAHIKSRVEAMRVLLRMGLDYWNKRESK